LDLAKIHFVAGKGGVGKTLISQALAHNFAQDEKTLLIEFSTMEKAALGPLWPRPLKKNLWYLTIDPDHTLYEYLHLKIQNKRLLDSLLGHNIIRTLGRALPGLSDLTRLGKIWFHADQRYGQDIYEKIVVDLPSSGFVSRFLSIAKVVHQAVKVGPVAKEAAIMAEYFSHPEHAILHIVTIAEELIINETIELYNDLRRKNDMTLGLLFVNRMLSKTLKELPTISDELVKYCPHIKKLAAFYRHRLDKELMQRKRLESEGIFMPAIFLADEANNIDRLTIASQIAEGLSGVF
jgi:anion-transporting  ArsA/GET3 family ATPase